MMDNFMVDPAPKRSRRDTAAARREQILDAACDMIFERGYERLSTTEIGAAVGVSGPAIYRHFASKADILAVLCDQTIDRLIEFVGPRRHTATAELEALVRGQVRLVIAYPKLVRSLPFAIRRGIRRREREHAARWVRVLRLLRPTARVAELEMLVFSAVGMILSVPRWPKPLQTEADLEDQLEASAWRILGRATTSLGDDEVTAGERAAGEDHS